MKYWQFLTGADAMYARMHPDGRVDYLDDDTLEWVESDRLASEVRWSGDWYPCTADEVTAARGSTIPG